MISVGKAKQIVALNPATDVVVIQELVEAGRVLSTEIDRLREWSYEGLSKTLRDELPLTMTLGLVKILIERMVIERMFAERIEGVVAAARSIAEEAGKGEA